ncbi:MAG: hypothetical protein K2N74_04650 [Clostridiales bacterium]|nr:hypothetical protein [Clostridiales bacterium]
MKKLLSIIISLAMILSIGLCFAGCGDSEKEPQRLNICNELGDAKGELKNDAGEIINGTIVEMYHCNEVFVYIKKEYKEKFLNREFTAEDFHLDNIDRINPLKWSENCIPECGIMQVFLKKTGEKFVKEAVEQTKSLDFAEDAEPCCNYHGDKFIRPDLGATYPQIYYSLRLFHVKLNSEYKEKFTAKSYLPADFGDNVKRIYYGSGQTWSGEEAYWLELWLKDAGERELREAMDTALGLPFVESVSVDKNGIHDEYFV